MEAAAAATFSVFGRTVGRSVGQLYTGITATGVAVACNYGAVGQYQLFWLDAMAAESGENCRGMSGMLE